MRPRPRASYDDIDDHPTPADARRDGAVGVIQASLFGERMARTEPDPDKSRRSWRPTGARDRGRQCATAVAPYIHARLSRSESR
jgi:hypothetical protein